MLLATFFARRHPRVWLDRKFHQKKYLPYPAQIPAVWTCKWRLDSPALVVTQEAYRDPRVAHVVEPFAGCMAEA